MSAQCHLVFPRSQSLHWEWGRPVYMELDLLATGGSRGTRADQGVCPTSSVQLSDIAHYYLPWLSLRK
jgi:hypothetical protein